MGSGSSSGPSGSPEVQDFAKQTREGSKQAGKLVLPEAG